MSWIIKVTSGNETASKVVLFVVFTWRSVSSAKLVIYVDVMDNKSNFGE